MALLETEVSSDLDTLAQAALVVALLTLLLLVIRPALLPAAHAVPTDAHFVPRICSYAYIDDHKVLSHCAILSSHPVTSKEVHTGVQRSMRVHYA